MQPTNLTNQLLIAMPGLNDPSFFHTVTYIFSHNEYGALGIVINRPLELDLGEVLMQMDLKTSNNQINNTTVYYGGPVQTDRGFVLHEPNAKWQSTINVSNKISVTTSMDILKAISEGRGPKKSFIALGYAGWQAGQLEQEIKDNAWLNAPLGSEIIFDAPFDRRWESAAALLGIDLERLSSQIGHA